jgi:hypothetical protein
MGDFYNHVTIYDREVKEPVLCNGYEDEPMLDIREAAAKNKENGVVGESGAEAFFCDTMQCVKEKDDVLKLCGMECHDDVIEEHINELCEDYKAMHDSVRERQRRIAKQEKLLEALAVKLNYDHIAFSPEGVTMVKNGVTYHYPECQRGPECLCRHPARRRLRL